MEQKTALNCILEPIQSNSIQAISSYSEGVFSRSSFWNLARDSLTSRLLFCPCNGLSSDREMTLVPDLQLKKMNRSKFTGENHCPLDGVLSAGFIANGVNSGASAAAFIWVWVDGD